MTACVCTTVCVFSDGGDGATVARVLGTWYALDMSWRDRIVVDPAVCHGQATIRGTRVLVSVVLDNLAAGLSTEDIVLSYPSLTGDDVRAAVGYAADLARERVVPLDATGS